MNFIKPVLVFVAMLLLSACNDISKSKSSSEKPKQNTLQLTISEIPNLPSFEGEHFRGLNILGDKVVISGSKGSVIYYFFSKNEFTIDSLGTHLHFRDAHAFENHHLLMSIQNPAQIIKETNGTKEVVLNMDDTLSFLDGMDFWENGSGILFGDPLLGKHLIYTSKDEGNSWERVELDSLIIPLENEGGFAASGTSIVCAGNGVGYIGFGAEEVRVLKTSDFGKSWMVQKTPMPKNQTGTGIYAMAFKDELNGVAVGGNWEFPDGDSSKIFTKDGGVTWQLSKGVQGYRSCVTHIKDDVYIATGTNGTDISYDNGVSWSFLDSIGFNAIQFADGINGIGVGNNGLIKLLKLQSRNE